MTAAVKVFRGDCREVLPTLEPDSVQCVVTSPPYYGLRDYSVEPSVWGGSGDCSHDWATDTCYREGGDGSGSALAFSRPGRENTVCSRCGAWRGCLGLERALPEYIAHIVEIFREVRRVLRKDGTCWLNMGDSFATGAGAVGDCPGSGAQGRRWAGYPGTRGDSPKHAAPAVGPTTQPNRMPQPGLKPKDLMMVPHRVAIALQEDGWWVRSDIVWHKPNPMPESVRDRPTKAHEYIFLLTKGERYLYDADAIREPAKSYTTKMPDGWDTRPHAHGSFHREGREKGRRTDKQRGHGRLHAGFNDRWDRMTRAEQQELGANKRDVWMCATQGFPGAHFATFPEDLVEPCILAGTSERGCCAECGAPWRRTTEKVGEALQKFYSGADQHGADGRRMMRNGQFVSTSLTTGWEPTCKHNAEVIPCTVLDPFMGSGTTLLVAARYHRNAIGIEMSPEYVEIAEKRLSQYQPTLPLAPLEGQRA